MKNVYEDCDECRHYWRLGAPYSRLPKLNKDGRRWNGIDTAYNCREFAIQNLNWYRSSRHHNIDCDCLCHVLATES